MLRFAGRLLLFVPLAMLIAGFNYTVDPAHRLRADGHEVALAALIADGSNVANPGNYDERRLQRRLAESPGMHDVLVLGSSRAMQVSAVHLPGCSLFNAAVSSAALEDLVALDELYSRRANPPRTVIVGLDPWMFNAQHGLTAWQSNADAFRFALDKLKVDDPRWASTIGGPVQPTTDWSLLLSPTYFQASLSDAFRWDGKARHAATTQDTAPGGVLLQDGSFAYPPSFRDRSKEAVAAAALQEIANTKHYLRGFADVDPIDAALLERWLDHLQRRGITVVLMLSPYHPLAFDLLNKGAEGSAIAKVEAHLRRTATRRKLTVLGSYDPARGGAGDTDFFDGMHPKRDYVARLFAQAIAAGELVQVRMVSGQPLPRK